MIDILPILLPALFFGSIFSAIAGTGLGIIMIIVFSLFFDIQTSIVLGVVMGFVVLPIKVFHFYAYIDWRFVRFIIALGIPLGYVGGILMFDIPIRILELILASFCFLFIVSRLSPRKFSIPDTNINLLLCGAFVGFQSGITGLGNMLRNPLLLAMGLSKERFVGTTAMIAFLIGLGRIIAYIPNIDWTADLQLMLLTSIPPIFIGIYIGKRILRHISKDLFEKLLLLVIFVGAVKLLLFS